MPRDEHPFSLVVNEREAGLRLDTFLSVYLADYSRSFLAGLIGKNLVHVDGKTKKAGFRLKGGETIHGVIPGIEPSRFAAEPIQIDIVYEDADLVAVNKPAGLVVHPAPGHSSGTLVNGLLHRFPDIEGIGMEMRPGIVHRLDKDTSGLMLVAKNSRVHLALSNMFKARRVQKQYLAIVQGVPKKEYGNMDHPIGRHSVDRKKMSTRSTAGKAAMTRWQVLERYNGFSLLQLDLHTGRTHQIRVHCSAAGHPVLGDPVYGSRKQIKERCRHLHFPEALSNQLYQVKRQMLHAWKLEFMHPVSEATVSLSQDMPADMAKVRDGLRESRRVPEESKSM